MAIVSRGVGVDGAVTLLRSELWREVGSSWQEGGSPIPRRRGWAALKRLGCESGGRMPRYIRGSGWRLLRRGSYRLRLRPALYSIRCGGGPDRLSFGRWRR